MTHLFRVSGIDCPSCADGITRALTRVDRVRAVARFTDADVQRLLADAGIVRHRGKIEAAINNAGRCVELVAETGSLAAYLWRFEPAQNSLAHNLATSPPSEALSRDLKQRGWKFVGPTTMHALMQAMGLINDHAPGCVTWAEAQKARDRFSRPR